MGRRVTNASVVLIVTALLACGRSSGSAKQEASNHPPVLAEVKAAKHFEYDAAGAPKGVTLTLEVTASDPDGDPLQYEWRATAGQITGTGKAVTWSGYQPGATVFVTVTDGHGGRATSKFVHE